MRVLLSTFIIFVCTSFWLCSASLGQSNFILTNYLYNPGSKTIGKIAAANGNTQVPKVKLVGESARLFTLGKDNTLAFQKNPAKAEKLKWYDVVIESTVGNKAKRDTFRILQDDFIRNQVIAHRGAWKNTGVSENSIGALKHAVALGCAGSEFDVHMSADSVLVINHDPEIQGIPIETAPSSQLLALKLPDGENMPTLEAYLKEGMKQNKTRMILEIKPSKVGKERGKALAKKVVAMVNKLNAQAWVDYISFDYDILKQVQLLDPYAKIAYLNGDKTPAELANDKFYGFDYNIKVVQKNEAWLEEAHQKNLTVNVWTVNDDQIMDWLLQKKVDFITTNEPELLLSKVKNGKIKP